MPRAPRGEQSSRKALARLAVDHSPPPGSRKRKRQKIDRSAGRSSANPKIMQTKLRSETVYGSELGSSNVEAGILEHDVLIKPPVKNKVRPLEIMPSSLRLILL